MTYEEALAAVTGPGGPYEIVSAQVRGVEMRVFKATPPSLPAVFEAVRAFGNKPFMLYEGEVWTFARLFELADRLGATLQQTYGVKKGDRVAIAMRNLPEWVASYIATLTVGAIATPLNAWWQTDELRYALQDCGAKVAIADPERTERSVAPASELGVPVIAVRAGGKVPSGAVALEEVLAQGRPDPVALGPDDPATILYTSGTTGAPKGALSDHRAILSALLANAARSAVSALRFPPEGGQVPEFAFILAVPLFHVTGCVPVLLSALATGSKLVLMRRWNPEEALEIIERERITHFVGVPTMSWDMLEAPGFASRDLSSLISMGGGGASVPPELIKRIATGLQKGRPGFGYGLTETNSYGPQIEGTDAIAKPTSAGRPLPIMEVAVLDPMGEPVPTGERGEICLSGPNVITEYWNKPDATAKAFFGKWLRTGDIGHLDEDGFVYIDDRIKDMVIRGGENVYCAEVEAAIYEHPAVHEAAVFGLPDPRLGEAVAAAVYPQPGKGLSAEELRSFLSGRIASFKVPSEIFILEEPLPRGATGKIVKRDLRDQYQKARRT
ncbi:MAG: class I adenylate-forming enzyme family protein [Actinomycetota bacterium]|nr:class I adenylate-forming enzyme family protein [Actinomycetota bacterium]